MIELFSDPLIWLFVTVPLGLAGWSIVLYCRFLRLCQTPTESMSIIAEMFPDNVLIVDAEGKIIACSQPACDFFGYARGELEGLKVEALMPGKIGGSHEHMRKTFLHGKPGKAMDNEVTCVSKAGEEIPAITRVRTFRLANSTYGLAAIMDLRSFRDREKELRALAERDPLTGVANRRRFDRDCHREWYRALRLKSSLAVVMVDVDSFKEYNDYHGHPGGDACLKTLAGILSSVCKRSTDVIARYGGEEFICLLPDTDLAAARALANELRRRVEEANIPHGRSPVSRWVTVSIGLAATEPRANDSIQDLIKAADTALYAAKTQGRNRVESYKPAAEPASA